MRFKWRKWIRDIHRDLGYIFFAITVAYALSGIALNHINDWNPNYIISIKENNFGQLPGKSAIDRDFVKKMLAEIGEEGKYKNHYFPEEGQLKIFITGGNIVVELETGFGYTEKIKRRPVFHLVNYLHYNPGKWWTVSSDIYSVALILLAITGLFMVRGPRGITRRGAWLTAAGILIPLLFILLFY